MPNAKTLLKVGVLAVMFVVEVAMNGGFLSQSNPGGYLGGAFMARSLGS
jgi:hypothetical protein